jgi:cyclophilin family peptidyl-prolyl cis-trans isomerase
VSPIEHLVDAFPEDIRFVYRHFPLNTIHDKADITARAAEAAGLQGQFFEFHNLLYERAAEWSSLPGEDGVRATLSEYAAELDLDVERFETDLDSPEIVTKLQTAYETAVSLGFRGTPTVILNGQDFPPQYLTAPTEQWAVFIESEKATAEALAALPSYERPSMMIDVDKEYLATVETEKGTFVIELFPQSAPETVNSFVFLAREGYYDGVTFHRVLEGFMAQTGDPSGTGRGGPGYTFEDEIDPDLTFDGPGWVAMANAGANTNGSQWFITYSAQPGLDGRHAIFGKVIEGMEVVDSITRRDPSADPNAPLGDQILSITIEER